jgi:hypothetical protein
MYSNVSSKISTRNFKTQPVSNDIGVLQGDPASCSIFLLVMQTLIDLLLLHQHKGFITSDSSSPPQQKPFFLTAFADDVGIFTRSKEDLQLLLDLCDQWASWAQMRFNTAKCFTFGIVKGKQTKPLLRLNNNDLPSFGIGDCIRLLGYNLWVTHSIAHIKEQLTSKLSQLLQKIDNFPLDNHLKLLAYSIAAQWSFGWPSKPQVDNRQAQLKSAPLPLVR